MEKIHSTFLLRCKNIFSDDPVLDWTDVFQPRLRIQSLFDRIRGKPDPDPTKKYH